MVAGWLRRRRCDETGASSVEYGLLVTLIASVTIFAVMSLGAVMQTVFLDTCKAIVTNSSKVPPGSCTP